ncbi:MAG: hypothetical protein HUJ68_03615 [Clostridia bacterium]|nr:hypothetical protein [Clostridia bacterium]
MQYGTLSERRRFTGRNGWNQRICCIIEVFAYNKDRYDNCQFLEGCHTTDDYFTYELTDDFLQDAAHHGKGKFDNIKVKPEEISDSDILI